MRDYRDKVQDIKNGLEFFLTFFVTVSIILFLCTLGIIEYINIIMVLMFVTVILYLIRFYCNECLKDLDKEINFLERGR